HRFPGRCRRSPGLPPSRREQHGHACRATSVASSSPLLTNYRGLMRVYHERLYLPLGWWLLGLATIVLLATAPGAGVSWPVAIAVYAVLIGGLVIMLLSWGRATVEVDGGELRAGPARLQLAAVGEVSALDAEQTRSLRGPRGDPAAFRMIRPYVRRAVYVEVA